MDKDKGTDITSLDEIKALRRQMQGVKPPVPRAELLETARKTARLAEQHSDLRNIAQMDQSQVTVPSKIEVTRARKAQSTQKKMRGLGRVYLPRYRDKRTGEVKTSQVYWIQWSVGGKTYRDSAETTRHSEAVDKLKAKLVEIGRGRMVGPEQKRLTLSNVAQEYLRDYEVRGLRSLDTARGRVAHLQDFFGEDARVVALTTDRIRAYQLHRKQEGAEAATINRETSALARMFTLAIKAARLSWRPPFPDRLEERQPRQGFFEVSEYHAVREHLFPVYQDVLDFAYLSGWRRSEITGLTWAEVDLHGGLIRLSPERSKSKEGRRLPVSQPLREVLGRRLAARRLDTSLVFHHNDGQPIGDFRKAWTTACVQAGLYRVVTVDKLGAKKTEKKVAEKLFHDLRRTVARNLIRSGTPEGIAMKLTGHKTRSVFERYNITSEDDLRQASLRLAEYLKAQAVTPASAPLKAARPRGRKK